MWPKALVQLIELAPHVTRLVPMADRYLQARAETRDTQRRALEQMADGLRGDLGQITDSVRGDLAQLAAAQAGIYHQLNQQSETLSRIASDMRTTRLTVDDMETRLTRMEKRMRQLWITLFAGMVLFGIFAAGVVAVFVVLHIRRYLHGS
jgi:hypothetical protein